MSRREAECEGLLEWLKQFGCRNLMEPKMAKQLLTPGNRSVWRHLQQHVKPVNSVLLVRKNVLLAKQNSHCKVESVTQVKNLKKSDVLQNKIDIKMNEFKYASSEVKSLLDQISDTKCNILTIESETEDLRNKTYLLSLKQFQIICYIKQLEEFVCKAQSLEKISITVKNPVKASCLTNIASDLLKTNLTPFKSLNNDDHEMLLDLSTSYPAEQVYQGLLQALNSLANRLKQIFLTLGYKSHISDVSTSNSSFSSQLHDLNTLVVKNQLKINSFKNKLALSSTVLDKEKLELIKAIRRPIESDNSPVVNDSSAPKEFINKLMDSMSSWKSVTLSVIITNIEEDCSTREHLKQLVTEKNEEKDVVYDGLTHRVNLINEGYHHISKYNVSVDQTRCKILQTCNKSFYAFISEEISQKQLEDLFSCLMTMVNKELELFTKAPLTALTRYWESNNQMVNNELIEKVNACTSVLLLQPGSKNVIKRILKKKLFALYYDKIVTN